MVQKLEGRLKGFAVAGLVAGTATLGASDYANAATVEMYDPDNCGVFEKAIADNPKVLGCVGFDVRGIPDNANLPSFEKIVVGSVFYNRAEEGKGYNFVSGAPLEYNGGPLVGGLSVGKQLSVGGLTQNGTYTSVMAVDNYEGESFDDEPLTSLFQSVGTGYFGFNDGSVPLVPFGSVTIRSNNVDSTPAPIPLPMGLPLLGAGLAAMGSLRSRRRNKAAVGIDAEGNSIVQTPDEGLYTTASSPNN